MRRSTLELLRCTGCRRGHLVPEGAVPEPRLVFGPVRCDVCQTRYPVGEGLIDLVGDRARPGGAQRAFEHPLLARSYERYVRPFLSLAVVRSGLDLESEYLLFRSLLGKPAGPILDLGCGTGIFARRLATDLPGTPLIGLDVSKSMIEEAMAQAREAAVAVDFVRAEMPWLPLQDGAVAAVLMAGSLQLVEGLDTLMREVHRVLAPEGVWVASTFLPPTALRPFHRALGLTARAEQDLRNAAERAGLVRFERVSMAPVMVVRAERPRVR